MLVAVTDHAVQRFRQRVGGALDARAEIIVRVRQAVEAGRCSDEPPAGAKATRGSAYVSDLTDRSLVFVCRRDHDELIVVTLWEREDGVADPRVPRRYTDALRRLEREQQRARRRS
jgi:hypothetical protein